MKPVGQTSFFPLVFFKVDLDAVNDDTVLFKAASLSCRPSEGKAARKLSFRVDRFITRVFFGIRIFVQYVSDMTGKIFVSQIFRDLPVCHHFTVGN